jgi:predicted ester cyclase
MTAGRACGNKILMREMVRVFETGDLSNVAAVVDAEYIDHQGLGGMALKSADGFSRVVTAVRTAVPDLRVRIEDLIAEDDRVVARLRWHGTRTTGEQVNRETIDVVRFAGGRAVEHWGTYVSTSENPRGSQPHGARAVATSRVHGLLLKESLADDGPLDLVHVTKITLSRVRCAIPPRPLWWTRVSFEADAEHAEEILQRFSAALRPTGWYLHCWTATHVFVVFPGKLFTYSRGDHAAQDEAIAYGLSVGVPMHHLDWQENLE